MAFRLLARIQDWLILLVLVAISASTVATQNEPFVRGLRVQSLELIGRVEGTFAWIGSYFNALEENSLLRSDNVRLSSRVARTREAELENARLKQLLELRSQLPGEVVAARIVSKDLTGQLNYLTIDVGTNDGVHEGMAVVDYHGVVGKVVLASNRYARVMPLLNTDIRIPAKVQPTQAAGIVRWDGRRADQLIMDFVIKTEAVAKGDPVVTSGFSEVFFPGFAIGTVDSVARRQGRNELLIFVRPAASIHSVEYAFVILAQPHEEQVSLENTPVQ